jgi:hypothetical protein
LEERYDGDGRRNKEDRNQSGGISGGFGRGVEETLSGGAALANTRDSEVTELSPAGRSWVLNRGHADVGNTSPEPFEQY